MNLNDTPAWLKCSWLLIMFLFSCLLLPAQVFTLSGQWKGKIYQTAGSVKTEYNIEIFLHHLPDKVVGRSYIYADEIHAEIKIVGTFIQGNIFEFRDIEILQSEQGKEMSWCMKSVTLELLPTAEGWELKGFWTGKNEYSQCNPGTLILKKVTNRA
ncbi:MAG: hypothetical protein ACI85O_000931 [Saprospiraceae bacterium]|jgi:hypothetical protein